METAAFVIALVSLLVTAADVLRNELRWRAERRRKVEVLAWHDGMGADIYEDATQVEQVIAVRVVNHGERDEQVMWTGVESSTGEPLADDRQKTTKIVDEPAPEARVLPPRGQVGAQHKIPAAALAAGFVGYAVLGDGKRYSVPVELDPFFADVQSMVRDITGHPEPGEEGPGSPGRAP